MPFYKKKNKRKFLCDLSVFEEEESQNLFDCEINSSVSYDDRSREVYISFEEDERCFVRSSN
ncbi:hypothetical protein KDX31_15875 [Amphritea atlantica]|uniref:Uncharacterized protein n=1 Tax=Amphritea atlantica TaxID=355243 RepID=A0ABY5GS86_9GAMM|nr:hypothetical protein KDX31_15875 [Amphritea atlantica]